jgi:hypothetical protein
LVKSWKCEQMLSQGIKMERIRCDSLGSLDSEDLTLEIRFKNEVGTWLKK